MGQVAMGSIEDIEVLERASP